MTGIIPDDLREFFVDAVKDAIGNSPVVMTTDNLVTLMTVAYVRGVADGRKMVTR